MKEPVKITRKELFEQVWAEPVSRVAERYGLSGTWIRKVCLENDVPVPPSRLLGARGCWSSTQEAATAQAEHRRQDRHAEEPLH